MSTPSTEPVQFKPFVLASGVRVDDWDNDRDGINWGLQEIKCSNDAGSIKLQCEALYDRLPLTNDQGTPRSLIKFFHLSGNLRVPGTHSIVVFIAY
jgi:hypothetical protein